MSPKELQTITDTVTCILLDIEGTTTSTDFVRKDLVNYGVQNVQKYVADHWDNPEVQNVVKELIIGDNEDELTECDSDRKSKDATEFKEAVINRVKIEIQSSQKSPAVKELEKLVLVNGFLKGELIGHLYPDVADALRVWNSQGKKIYIYSNGSVQSQHLLFKKNMHGDLRKYIDGNFDTDIGCKLNPVSYSKIVQTIGKLPNEVLFFSDRPKELVAAKEAGLKTVLVVRNPECLTFPEEMCCLKPTDPTINSFLEVLNNDETKN